MEATTPRDPVLNNVLEEIRAKQGRMEQRMDQSHAIIIDHLRTLRQLQENSGMTSSVLWGIADANEKGSAALGIQNSPVGIQKSPTRDGSLAVLGHGSSKGVASAKARGSDQIDEGRKPRAQNRISCMETGLAAEKPPRSWKNMSHAQAARYSASVHFLDNLAHLRTARRSQISETSLASSRKGTQDIGASKTFNEEEEQQRTSKTTFHLVEDRIRNFSITATQNIMDTLVGTISGKKSFLVNLVHHPLFQGLCGTMVIFNSVLVGITVEVDTHLDQDPHPVWEYLGQGLSVFFLFELVVRIKALGITQFFLRAEDRYMNLFDALLVVVSIVDTVTVFSKQYNAKGNNQDRKQNNSMETFKTVRLLRILRIFRIFRFFRELSLMVFMIVECLTSLFWAIVLLGIIMYTFAIIFTQSSSIYRRSEKVKDANVNLDIVEEMFGTVPRTWYYLFQSMLGGISWGQVSDTMIRVSPTYSIFFFFFIAFTMLAVLNIITGIFVDNALETSRMQREWLVKREEKVKANTMKELAKMFDEIDEDVSGSLTWPEMELALEQENIKNYFRALGLDLADMRHLFEIMDDDGSGEIDVEEFLDGCSRCTGDAKSIDIHTVLHTLKRLNKRFDKLETMVDPNIGNGALKKKTSRDQTSLPEEMSTEMKKLLMIWSRTFVGEFQQLKQHNQVVLQKLDDALCQQQNHPKNLKPRWAPAGKLSRDGFSDDDMPLEVDNGDSPVCEAGAEA